MIAERTTPSPPGDGQHDLGLSAATTRYPARASLVHNRTYTRFIGFRGGGEDRCTKPVFSNLLATGRIADPHHRLRAPSELRRVRVFWSESLACSKVESMQHAPSPYGVERRTCSASISMADADGEGAGTDPCPGA